MSWTDIAIGSKRAAFCDAGEMRLYVCERAGDAEAWVGGAKVGNFADLDTAKTAAERKALGKPLGRSYTYKAFQAPVTVVADPPVAPVFTNRQALPSAPEPASDAVGPIAESPGELIEGHCKCGAMLGRSGACPALCEPVPEPPPKYTGPAVVGSTHIGSLGAPVKW